MDNKQTDAPDPADRATGKLAVPSRHGFGARTEEHLPPGDFFPSGKFGRLFPALKPLIPDPKALEELGNAMTEPAAGSTSQPLSALDNPDIPAGYTYLGQFIDHDITFDTTSLQEVLVDPLALHNFRTPLLDLDCIYGSGPVAQPYLYKRDDSSKFLIGNTRVAEGEDENDPQLKKRFPNDLQRNGDGFAVIGDPRNDENLIVAQTQLAFLKFHNKVVEMLKNDGGSNSRQAPIRKSIFEEARDIVIWHYQWIVVNDFLKTILDKDTFEDVFTKGPKFYKPEGRDPFIPVEFSGAAYRFGHTMVRNRYRYNRFFSGDKAITFKELFDFSGLSTSDRNNLPITSKHIIDWRQFFKVDESVDPQKSRKLDPYLVSSMHLLPVPEPKSLAVRNLLRGRSLGLPPGQSLAKVMRLTPLTPEQLQTGSEAEIVKRHGFDKETPLWYYILKEAEVQGQGLRLGEVGSRIIAEVFYGVLIADQSSYLSRDPCWLPTLPRKNDKEFTMADLLNFVGDIDPLTPTPIPTEEPVLED